MATYNPGDSSAAIGDLTFIPPVATSGVPTGLDGCRLVIEVATVVGATWDSSVWDTGTWAKYVWRDITTDGRGTTINQGASSPGAQGGFPNLDVGTCSIIFDNKNFQYSFFNNANDFAPDNLIRVSLVKASPSTSTFTYLGFNRRTPTNWWPIFTGLIESCKETITNDGERRITVTAVETAALVARVNKSALATAVGEGESFFARLQRIITAAGFPFQMFIDGDVFYPDYTVQRTTLAMNAWAECQLTANSANAIIYSDTDGNLCVRSPYAAAYDLRYRLTNVSKAVAGDPYIGSYLGDIIYASDEIEFDNNSDFVVNYVSLTESNLLNNCTIEDVYSQSVFGLKTFSRNDLITNGSNQVTQLANQILVTFQGINTNSAWIKKSVQPTKVMLFEQANTKYLRLFDAINMDFYQSTATTTPFRMDARIIGITHTISALNAGRVYWKTNLNLMSLACGPAPLS